MSTYYRIINKAQKLVIAEYEDLTWTSHINYSRTSTPLIVCALLSNGALNNKGKWEIVSDSFGDSSFNVAEKYKVVVAQLHKYDDGTYEVDFTKEGMTVEKYRKYCQLKNKEHKNNNRETQS